MRDEVKQIDPRELQEMMENREVTLLDVRERHEWDYCHIDGAALIPLSNFSTGQVSTEGDAPVVVYCHTGQRSYMAARILQQQGHGEVYNLAGGIDAYAVEVDQDMPRY